MKERLIACGWTLEQNTSKHHCRLLIIDRISLESGWLWDSPSCIHTALLEFADSLCFIFCLIIYVVCAGHVSSVGMRVHVWVCVCVPSRVCSMGISQHSMPLRNQIKEGQRNRFTEWIVPYLLTFLQVSQNKLFTPAILKSHSSPQKTVINSGLLTLMSKPVWLFPY